MTAKLCKQEVYDFNGEPVEAWYQISMHDGEPYVYMWFRDKLFGPGKKTQVAAEVRAFKQTNFKEN